MGVDYEGQEKAIAELSELSDEAKSFLSHHLRNSLFIVIGGIETSNLDAAIEAARHMVADLEKFGC